MFCFNKKAKKKSKARVHDALSIDQTVLIDGSGVPVYDDYSDVPFKYEGLSDDDDDVPWAPPSVQEAINTRRRTHFAGGRATVCGTSGDDVLILGVGIASYLAFLVCSEH